MQQIKWIDKQNITNEKVRDMNREKKYICRRAQMIGHILRHVKQLRNSLEVIKEKMPRERPR